ncbi:hypothetical protein HPP92_023616 [Vanilla planifolia]|uniref:Uncharacterized protein n=1 Tax=Vanilla planifolia TaxID=51239 RepID=A0A835PVP2_VANPL|nr:hypothetical protein HPP92_023616 [Vanilla planifolia]
MRDQQCSQELDLAQIMKSEKEAYANALRASPQKVKSFKETLASAPMNGKALHGRMVEKSNEVVWWQLSAKYGRFKHCID